MEYLRIPLERVGVLVGKEGSFKRYLEEATGTRVDLNSETGEVAITKVKDTGDPLSPWVARDIVKAIGRGFSSEKACRLLGEGQTLRVIDLGSELGKSDSVLQRQRSRLIGKGGRTREIMEQTTRCDISIMGRTVSIMGDDDGIAAAQEAIEMIIRGVPHSIVYRFLERKSSDLKQRDKEMWRKA